MQAGEKEKKQHSGRFRRELKTFWPRSHPVVFPHLQTDHWSKMKTMVPVYFASLPPSLLKESVAPSHGSNSALDRTTGSPLPPLTQDEGAGTLKKTSVSPRNMSQYRNVFNERARTGFCYWLVEKSPTCKGCSLGAYKTFLGLPKV
ncbi:uncharacterized protein LOC143418614 [Maylandia zebra]|uniref:uncharacterized protein LOC143418614 n=1 Tax=Maylandia zebra TaxID=106582 RepID=UPI00403CAEB0